VWADEPAPRLEPLPARLPIPAGLPRYEIDAYLDLTRKVVEATERVHFTNRSNSPTTELIFHVYPRYRVQDSDRAMISKTLEILRLSPEEAMDRTGGRMNVSAVEGGASKSRFEFDPNDATIMIVPLANPVQPGEEATVSIRFSVELPNYWGRWG